MPHPCPILRRRRGLVTVAGLTLLTATLAGCTDSGPAAVDTAEDLATALEQGTVPAVLFSGGSPQQEYDDIVAGLGELTPTVEVGDVTEDDTAATADLTWTWDVAGTEWTYRTEADLEQTTDSWAVEWSPQLVEPSLAEDERLDVTRVPAERGSILGARGVPLVTSRPVVRVGIDKSQLSRARLATSGRRLAAAVGVAPGPYVALLKEAGAAAFVEAIVLRKAEARPVVSGLGAIPGALAVDDELPLAPTREFAAPILGRVGPATAEIVKESDGRIEAGDDTGLSGLQLRYDEQLAGTPGLEVDAVDGEGGSRELFVVDPVDGEPLATTLDPQLQAKAERVLAVPEGTEAPATALVAVRPSDGAILTAASGAGADGLNVATFGQYAPGSTFKVVTSLALLRSGLTPESRVGCPPTTTVDGKQFKNYDDYPADGFGSITLRRAVANSCNTAFIGARNRLGTGELADAAAALGLGVDQDLGFPAYFGQVPDPASQTEAAANLIGQGKVLASPLVMATVAASVQSGRTVVPYLLDEFRPEATPEVPLTGREADALRDLMRAVVSEGSGSVLAGLGDVGAKTGTAEYGRAGTDGSLPTHAWMIAFRGDLAVAAFVETGDSGSSTAGPLLRELLAR